MVRVADDDHVPRRVIDPRPLHHVGERGARDPASIRPAVAVAPAREVPIEVETLELEPRAERDVPGQQTDVGVGPFVQRIEQRHDARKDSLRRCVFPAKFVAQRGFVNLLEFRALAREVFGANPEHAGKLAKDPKVRLAREQHVSDGRQRTGTKQFLERRGQSAAPGAAAIEHRSVDVEEDQSRAHRAAILTSG